MARSRRPRVTMAAENQWHIYSGEYNSHVCLLLFIITIMSVNDGGAQLSRLFVMT